MNPKTKEATEMGIGKMSVETRSKILGMALNPVREFVSADLVKQSCARANYEWRACLWNPLLTLLACIRKEQDGSSARQVEDWVATFAPLESSTSRDGKDFCAARSRLAFAVFYDVMQQVGRRATAQAGQYYRSLPVYIVDGTTLRTPNTTKNDTAFGRSRNKIRLSRTPIVRLLVLVCAGCGAVLASATGAYRTSELELFVKLLAGIPTSTLILADRGFCSFLLVGRIQYRGSYVLTRYHATRRGQKKKSFGRHEWLEEWDRPFAAQAAHPEFLLGLPETIQVRVITREIKRPGYRVWTLKIATTLLDRHTYLADELVNLYLQRWDVELDLRALKTDAYMSRLTTKTPDLIGKEICSILLTHNCIVAVMSQSGAPVRSLSHTRARELLNTYSDRMAAAPTRDLPRLYAEMLLLIAQTVLEQRERPPEPRSIIQRPSPYPVLMTSRNEWRRAHRVA
jgi:hypothetical protein